MTALTLASLITLSSSAKGYIHPCGFRPHCFAFMKALSPSLCRLPSLCSHSWFNFVGLLAGIVYLWGKVEVLV